MSVSFFKEMVEGVDPSVVNALAVIGGLVLVRSALGLLGAVFTTFLRPGKNLKKYGAWAVVTGATGERSGLPICGLQQEILNRSTLKSISRYLETCASCEHKMHKPPTLPYARKPEGGGEGKRRFLGNIAIASCVLLDWDTTTIVDIKCPHSQTSSAGTVSDIAKGVP